MSSQPSLPEWLSELVTLRDNRDRSAGDRPPLHGTDYGHFVLVYRRVVAAGNPKWAYYAPFERERCIRDSLNSRIYYALRGRPIATKHLEEVWNIFITEKLIS